MPAASIAASMLPDAVDPQQLYRTLFGSYPDAVLVVDTRGRVLLANPAAAEFLRYPLDVLVGLHIEDLVPEGSRARHAAYRAGYNRNPWPRAMGGGGELVARRRDGSEVMVEVALSPLRSAGGPLVVVALRDTASFPRMQVALRRARYSEFVTRLGRAAVDGRRTDQPGGCPRTIARRSLEVGWRNRRIRQSDAEILQDGGAFVDGSGERADGGGDRLVDAGGTYVGEPARVRRDEGVS